MNGLRLIIGFGFTVFSLIAPRTAIAQTTAAPTATPTTTVVLHDNGSASSQNLKGVPPAVAALIVNFDTQRDKYLLQQHLLLEKLANATTPEQRETIRDQLQDNRQAFLDELASFRIQLKDELQDLKGRISNAEFLRIIDAAHNAASTTHFRRGQ